MAMNKKLNEMIKAFKENLERQDNRKYTIKEVKEILGIATLNEWRDELRWQ